MKLLELKEFYMIFFILTLEQIIVLNKHCTYNKPIPKISHIKTLQNSCKMEGLVDFDERIFLIDIFFPVLISFVLMVGNLPAHHMAPMTETLVLN